MAERTIHVCDICKNDITGAPSGLTLDGTPSPSTTTKLDGESVELSWAICASCSVNVERLTDGGRVVEPTWAADVDPLVYELKTALRTAMVRDGHDETDCAFRKAGTACPMCDPLDKARGWLGEPAGPPHAPEQAGGISVN